MQLAMVFQGDDDTGYISSDGKTVLRREGIHEYHWVLRVDGVFNGKARYRNDIAKKYNLTLTILYPDYIQ